VANILRHIEGDHAVQSKELDILNDAFWFKLGLNRLEKIHDVKEKTKNYLMRKTKNLRVFLLKREKLLQAKKNLSNLFIENVGAIPLNQILPANKLNDIIGLGHLNTFKEPLTPGVSYRYGIPETKEMFQTDIRRKFEEQVALGIDSIELTEFQDISNQFTNIRHGGKRTRKRRGTRTKR